ncbi:MAG TPA: metallophosphoesterase family protein [Candidatus Udaeobacter sp.]|jgi:putative phosphoesterase|nr:metallophosphoesterase family protein [Candidatus Udaeobacter sp.]
MLVAALYDIHGNQPALDAVLGELLHSNADRVVIGGDVVPGPMPHETLERLCNLDRRVDFITGNGELAVLSEIGGDDAAVPVQHRRAIRWNAAQLSPSDRKLLGTWPATLQMHIEGIGKVLFCHATPNSAHDIFTRLTSDDVLRSLFGHVDADLVVCGHTHMQFDRSIGKLRVVNAGSVGMPFGKPGAYWLLLGPQIEFRRTRYDLQSAAARIRATEYPDAEVFAAQNVLMPPSEEKMLKAFAKT